MRIEFQANNDNLPVEPIIDILYYKPNIMEEEILRTIDFLNFREEENFEESDRPLIHITIRPERAAALASLAKIQGEEEACSFNLLDCFSVQNDELLDALLAVTSYFDFSPEQPISPEQRKIAQVSLVEFTTYNHLAPLTLAKLWSDIPCLHEFSIALRKRFCC